MNATKSAMIPVKSITIEQAEGLTGQMYKGVHTTWEAANQMLARIKHIAPKDSYYKTDVTITWADGLLVRSREDVSNNERYSADLAANIRNTWLFYAGLKKPDHLTEEDYDRITGNVARRDAAVSYLKKYDLHDSVAVISKALPDVQLISKAEINDAIERVGGLLARIEAPEMRSVMSREQVRVASLDMRRALASLIRVRDATPNATS